MKTILISLIKFYRKFISSGISGSCRFTPSCSLYGLEAVSQHGAVRGSLYAAARVLRCNHFVKGGFDPVPQSLKGDNKWVL